MNNINAPTQLAVYAGDHGIDLTPYYEALSRLRTKAVWDPEPPFANAVLIRLRLELPLDAAIEDAVNEALATLRSYGSG